MASVFVTGKLHLTVTLNHQRIDDADRSPLPATNLLFDRSFR
ncbi:MAG: hypothetical protein PVH63_13290 [Balneolaceae bacterium]